MQREQFSCEAEDAPSTRRLHLNLRGRAAMKLKLPNWTHCVRLLMVSIGADHRYKADLCPVAGKEKRRKERERGERKKNKVSTGWKIFLSFYIYKIYLLSFFTPLAWILCLFLPIGSNIKKKVSKANYEGNALIVLDKLLIFPANL